MLKNKDIFVAVEWKDGVRSSLPIEMASFLAPGYRFQDRKIVSQSQCERQRLNILSVKHVDKTSDHYQYFYNTDKGTFSFTGFELARTLFLHNPHLVRSAFSANGLSGLAYVNLNKSPVEISFPESTKYPVTFIGTKNTRVHLAWMLLDKEAKKSAFTIFESFKNDGGRLGFKFVPPNLDGWQLDVSFLSHAGNDFYEVVRVENIVEAATDKKFSDIEVDHPKHKGKGIDKGKRGEKAGRTPENDIEPELDLGAIPAYGSRLDIQRKSGFSFNVPGMPVVNLSNGNEKKATASSLPTNESAIPKETAGVGIPEKDGDAQEFNPSINQDDEVCDIDLPQKFALFEEVIEEVAKSEGITLIQKAKCFRFPMPETTNRTAIFDTTYEGRLKYFMAIVEVKGFLLVLVEADTNNLKKPKGSSTLILGLKSDAKTNLEEIVQCFSDKGAQWSHAFIKERCYFFIPCRHPSLKNKDGVRTGQEYKEKWVSDLRLKLKRIEETT